jgi:hypothetical protein
LSEFAGFATFGIDQAPAENVSANTFPLPELSLVLPTAAHDVALLQDTLSRSAKLAPAGFFVGLTVHVEPLSCSASTLLAPVCEEYVPTAMQAVAELHETESNSLDPVPDGTGVWTTDQVEPLNVST